jgi:hypothetical protein
VVFPSKSTNIPPQKKWAAGTTGIGSLVISYPSSKHFLYIVGNLFGISPDFDSLCWKF